MRKRSSRNLASSALLSMAAASSASLAALRARRHPSAMVCGWIRWLMRSSASRSNSPQSTATLVVPSPTSSSCTRAISTSTFAAALSRFIDLRIVAPSFVTETLWSCSPMRWSILSMPFGPSVVFTKSAIAMAPTKELKRAFSPLSTVVPESINAASIVVFYQFFLLQISTISSVVPLQSSMIFATGPLQMQSQIDSRKMVKHLVAVGARAPAGRFFSV
mmetsp:Transcript_14107/g.33012  ORF Transcript_14107/g.33012 Transcript_14107/m.33012 type:complete len:219 (+) Transcript_14107:1231-1887(+)